MDDVFTEVFAIKPHRYCVSMLRSMKSEAMEALRLQEERALCEVDAFALEAGCKGQVSEKGLDCGLGTRDQGEGRLGSLVGRAPTLEAGVVAEARDDSRGGHQGGHGEEFEHVVRCIDQHHEAGHLHYAQLDPEAAQHQQGQVVHLHGVRLERAIREDPGPRQAGREHVLMLHG